VAELTTLAKTYGVKIVWLADENFAADRPAAGEVLNLLIEADLGLSLNVNMTAADVVRDADLLPLYKAAGVDYVVMGVEALKDELITSVRKNNPFQVSRQAVQLLRQNKIISLVNIIYGLEDESLTTVKSKLRKLYELDPDILNAVYLTPHFWTAAGRATNPQEIIQVDQSRWTYRNQVLSTPYLSPGSLFGSIKLTEALFHLRPKALVRLFYGGDWKIRRILRSSLAVGFRVVLAEMVEFWLATAFAPQGSFEGWPGKLNRPVPTDQSPVTVREGRGKKIASPLV
jgi:anaerobic magnesium-protoporphyrin IX monomethyl ester cyclase